MGEDVKRLRELVGAATARPWRVSDENTGGPTLADDGYFMLGGGAAGSADEYCCAAASNYGQGWEQAECDADLIVAAVNALPALLDVYEAAKRLTERDPQFFRLGAISEQDANHLRIMVNRLEHSDAQ